MQISSTAFQDNTYIPSDYTCDGEDYNPPLTFSKVPTEAESLVLIVEDPDAPSQVFTHWILFDMPPATLEILKHQVPLGTKQGMNDFGNVGYGGPCPPSGTHHYHFKLFALETLLNLLEGATKEAVEKAMKGHVIESAELVGLYKKQNQ